MSAVHFSISLTLSSAKKFTLTMCYLQLWYKWKFEICSEVALGHLYSCPSMRRLSGTYWSKNKRHMDRSLDCGCPADFFHIFFYFTKYFIMKNTPFTMKYFLFSFFFLLILSFPFLFILSLFFIHKLVYQLRVWFLNSTKTGFKLHLSHFLPVWIYVSWQLPSFPNLYKLA